ncbi:uncharacterized protein LOC132294787 [Cornus florida]|uniref:uncharacterized protein LOC132294787 n=1 Tax=Cornus florida TaxID=4283 RepID=UPI002898F784|nr:uncharacterized protein LOC132294787 [Cornus florida]
MVELWVVAAATGAAYIAKYWQNLSGGRDGSLESFSWNSSRRQSEFQNLLQQIDRTGPYHRLAPRRLDGDVSSERRDVSDWKFQEMNWVSGDSMARVASTSGGNKGLANVGKFSDHNVLQSMSLPTEFRERERFQENVDEISARNEFLGNFGDALFEFANGRFMRSKSLRSRGSCGFLVKPLNSLENSLTAHLYRERAKMEEYVFRSLPSPSTPTVRPLLVTDGSRIISRASGDSFGVHSESGEDKLKSEGGVCLEENNTMLRSSSFQQTGLVEVPRKLKQRCGRRRLSRSGVPLHSQGSSNGLLIFFIGITIGILSAVVANKREMDKLNELLKKSKGLVQDLHEELEMKGMLTVKELTTEDSQSHKTIGSFSFNQDLVAPSSKREVDESTKYNSKEQKDQQSENPELMSEIEAELEAELERLELNMKASTLERISDFVELDPDFEADVVKGDLKLDMTNGQPGDPSDTHSDASGTSTGQTDMSNYAVSPLKLSLRLHEVIESRLEARIKELETALENSQKKVHSLESQRMISQGDLVCSEVRSSSTPESPTITDEEGNDINWPMGSNLSGEDLDAYNEAYDGMIRMTDTNNDTPDAISNANNIEKEMHPFQTKLFEGRNNGDNASTSRHESVTEERWSRSLVSDMIRTWEEGTSRSRGSYEVDDDDDSMGKLLIKQVVEKTRHGSSIVLNGQMCFRQ